MIQEVRRTRHDMKNNMIYLKELLNTDAEKARKFLDEYIGQSEATDEISKSGNLAVDALINYKNMTAREKGITIHLESQISFWAICWTMRLKRRRNLKLKKISL